MALDDASLAGELVTEAGRLAAGMRAEGVKADTKTSISDIVTAADHAAEHLVVQRLRQERPDDAILGEEGANQGGTSGRRWVIDPVDGTYNFFAGLHWWCSALALTDGDELVLGAIYQPDTDSLYVGGPDLPTTLNGHPLERLRDLPLSDVTAATYLHPPWFGTEVGEAWERAARRAATLRVLGSGSMDATAIAQGSLGVAFQHSVPDWDRLPGAAVILGAGGVTDQVEAGGKLWSIAGRPQAVEDVRQALVDH